MVDDVDLRVFGGATFRRAGKKRGIEPTKCYKLGKLEEDGVPNIAVEVIVSNALVDKMAVYAGLGVPEVWEWRPEAALSPCIAWSGAATSAGNKVKLFLICIFAARAIRSSPERIQRVWPRRTRRRCDRPIDPVVETPIRTHS